MGFENALKDNGLSISYGLRAFKNIKRLGVSWAFLIEKEPRSIVTHVDSHQILPSMLEVMQVQLPEDYEWNPFPRSKELKPDYKTFNVVPLELGNSLILIALLKSSHYPRLREFTNWQKHAHWWIKPQISESVWRLNLERIEVFNELGFMCWLAKIDLSLMISNHPPYFCA